LVDEELEKLRVLEPRLVDMIDPSVVYLLLKSGCISAGHLEAIMKQTSDRDKNKEFLNIMKRRSFAQYKKFVECMLETHQTQVVTLLESYNKGRMIIGL